VFYTKGDPSGIGKPAATATTVRDGGWRGGGEKPDPAWKQIPSSAMCIDEELYEELVTAMETTGWYGADAWYMNHARNKVRTSDCPARNCNVLRALTLHGRNTSKTRQRTKASFICRRYSSRVNMTTPAVQAILHLPMHNASTAQTSLRSGSHAATGSPKKSQLR
jgi:hypothetical protein